MGSFTKALRVSWASLVAQPLKTPPINAGDLEFWEDLLEKGNGHSLQFSCLENSMDRGAWRATVQEVTESDAT